METDSQAQDWPRDGGEIGSLMRDGDWESSALGQPQEWSQSLKRIIDLVLDSPVAMAVLWGPQRVRFYNDAFRAFLGQQHPQTLGAPVVRWDLEPSASQGLIYDAVLAGKAMTLRDQSLDQADIGTVNALFDLTYSPLRDEKGEVGGVLLTAIEKSPHRRHAIGGAWKPDGAGALTIADLQHRIRNMLAVIRSIVRRTAENSLSVEDFAMHLEGRIDAFARVETALARDSHDGLDLAAIVADEFDAAAAREGQQVILEGDEIFLRPKAAERMALAVHELTTNAIKHGALSVPQGRIRVAWTIKRSEEGEIFVFDWRESGVKIVSASRRGFGTDLLERSLAYEMNATVKQSLEADGFRCSIEIPLGNVIMR